MIINANIYDVHEDNVYSITELLQQYSGDFERKYPVANTYATIYLRVFTKPLTFRAGQRKHILVHPCMRLGLEIYNKLI